MKKLINDPRAVVREMLEGAVALAPGQALLEAGVRCSGAGAVAVTVWLGALAKTGAGLNE